MMGYYGWHPVTRSANFFGYGFGLISTIIFVVLIIAFLYAIFKHSSTAISAGGDDEALKILKTRYAKGEIDKKKFEEMKKDIK